MCRGGFGMCAVGDMHVEGVWDVWSGGHEGCGMCGGGVV